MLWDSHIGGKTVAHMGQMHSIYTPLIEVLATTSYVVNIKENVGVIEPIKSASLR